LYYERAYLAAQGTEKKKPEIALENFDMQFLNGNISEDPAQRLVEEEDLGRIYSVIRNSLSEFELDVCSFI
jgi:hypothetical protein